MPLSAKILAIMLIIGTGLMLVGFHIIGGVIFAVGLAGLLYLINK